MATRTRTSDRDTIQNQDAVPEKRTTLARKVSERFRREDPHYIRHFLSIMVARVSSRIARALPTPCPLLDRRIDLATSCMFSLPAIGETLCQTCSMSMPAAVDLSRPSGMSTTSLEYQRETGPTCWSCRSGPPPSSSPKLL